MNKTKVLGILRGDLPKIKQSIKRRFYVKGWKEEIKFKT